MSQHTNYPYRSKLERPCRYVARPPLAMEHLSVTDEDKLRYALRQPYSHGTTYFLFEPINLLARLAALVPRPRVNQIRYHGVFAPNSFLRARIVPGRTRKNGATQAAASNLANRPSPKQFTWETDLGTAPCDVPLKRAFEFDVTVCPLCGGTLRGIADITDPAIIDKILSHIRQSRAPPAQAQKRASFTDSDQQTQGPGHSIAWV